MLWLVGPGNIGLESSLFLNTVSNFFEIRKTNDLLFQSEIFKIVCI